MACYVAVSSRQRTAQSQKAVHTHSSVLLVLGELVANGVLKERVSQAWFWAAQLSVESYWTLIFDLLLFFLGSEQPGLPDTL